MAGEVADIPPIDKNLLVDYAGWEGWKEGVAVAQRGGIALHWEAQGLRGELIAGGRKLFPRIEWRRGTLHDFTCQCAAGRRAEFCGHLSGMLATVMQQQELVQQSTETLTVEEALPPLRGFRISEQKGIVLKLAIRVAPNWSTTLAQGKVIVLVESRVEGRQVPLEQLDRGKAYQWEGDVEGCLRWIGEWCQGKYAGMLQLTRGQLRKLVAQKKSGQGVSWHYADGPAIEEGDPFWASVNSSSSAVATITRPLPEDPVKQPKLPPKDTQKVSVRCILNGSEQYLSLRFQPLLTHWKEWAHSEGLKWEPSNQRFWLRDPLRVRPFLSRHWNRLREQTQLLEEAHFIQVFAQTRMAFVHAAVSGEGSEREIRFVVKDATGEVVEAEIDWDRGTLRSADPSLLLDYASWERARQMREVLQRETGGVVKHRVRPGEEAYWSQQMSRHGMDLEAPADWRAKTTALSNFSALEAPALPAELEAQLRVYQKIGVAWIQHLFRNQLSGILADEMGLGKTVQTIAALVACQADVRLPQPPWLIVCPASLVGNWKREIVRFAPSIRVGDLASEMPTFVEKDLWIGSYHRVARMIETLSTVEFGVVVADEAQHIKNESTQIATALRLLQSRNRLLLTGTPLENRMEDVVSLFRFLLPGYLNLPAKAVTGEARRQWLNQVPARVAPYILRRTRGQVLSELPERTDQLLFADMTERQAQLYHSLAQQASAEWQAWEQTNDQAGRMKVLAMLTRLRQASVEPRTLHPDWSREDSAKAELFAEILEEAMQSGSRMLVFSQFVSVLEIWRRDLAEAGIPSCFIHGETKDRMREIDRFEQDPNIHVFFLSLKTGGTGFNLTAADKVVLLDPWWNPAIEEQAISRAYRMGQTKAVHSMRLIATSTVEERVIHMQQEKRLLLDSLWESAEQEQQSAEWSEHLRDLFAAE